jgi:hypothetical protein
MFIPKVIDMFNKKMQDKDFTAIDTVVKNDDFGLNQHNPFSDDFTELGEEPQIRQQKPIPQPQQEPIEPTKDVNLTFSLVVAVKNTKMLGEVLDMYHFLVSQYGDKVIENFKIEAKQ